MKRARRLAAALAAAMLASCAPLVIGTIVAGTAIVATDRRTAGAQLDDQSIQLRVSNELGTAFKDNHKEVHISVNSYERKVLLTGEVPTEETKARAGEIAARSQNVGSVVNELVVAPPSTLGQRTNDTALGTKVRAQFISTKELASNAISIVTERGVIFLMGFVTEKEGDIAAHVASRVAGVQQVVKLFDYGSAEEVAKRRALGGSTPPASAPAPVTSTPVTTTPGTAR
jgi:osmotically-inducible protein OsmY